MRFLLILIMLCYFSAVAQTYNEKLKVLNVIETRDTIGLLNIYSDWNKNSIPIDSEELNQQIELIQEAYAIYPLILERFTPITDKYILVNNSIKIETSLNNLNLDSIYKKKFKDVFPSVSDEDLEFYPRGCSDFLRELERDDVSRNYLNSAKNKSFVLNNFLPFYPGNLLKLIYENEPSRYLEYFKIAMTDSVIEQSLLKTGKKIEQIRKLQGQKWGYWNEVSKENNLRQDFCYSFRINIKDRLKRIIFQPDFRTAFVEYTTYYGNDEYTILYFEKINNKWFFKEEYIYKTNFGYDARPRVIR